MDRVSWLELKYEHCMIIAKSKYGQCMCSTSLKEYQLNSKEQLSNSNNLYCDLQSKCAEQYNDAHKVCTRIMLLEDNSRGDDNPPIHH